MTMGMTHITLAIAISFTSLIPSSCSKHFGSKAPAKPSPMAATNTIASTNGVATTNGIVTTNPDSKNLGTLSLRNNYQTAINLGGGRTFIIVPKLQERDQVQLTISLQVKQTNQIAPGIEVRQLSTRLGTPQDVTIGDVEVVFTPEMSR